MSITVHRKSLEFHDLTWLKTRVKVCKLESLQNYAEQVTSLLIRYETCALVVRVKNAKHFVQKYIFV
jgi:hypothetical protein